MFLYHLPIDKEYIYILILVWGLIVEFNFLLIGGEHFVPQIIRMILSLGFQT